MSAVGFTVPTGIACDDCDATEQDCARNYPCCVECTHFTQPEQAADFAPRTQAVCGTEGGYVRHRRRGEPFCEPCRLAHNEYTTAYKRRVAENTSRCSGQYAGTDTGYRYHRRDGTLPCDACRAGHSQAERDRQNRRDPNRPRKATDMTMTSISTPTPPTVSELLARARQVNDPKVTRAAQRVVDAADRLREALADVEGRTAARREVERLERQLAEAKAKLRGGARPVAAPRHTNAGSHPCSMVGCDRTFDSGQGRALHERRAHGHAA